MKKLRERRKRYIKPSIKSDKEAKEFALNCPTTNVKYCSYSYSPKKGS